METRFTEIRAEGKRLVGTVVSYGDVAVVAGQPERFAPGSLLCNDAILNRQHQRDRPLARTGAGLVLRDTPDGLHMEAELPSTSEANDVLTLVRSGVLRGLSAEFEVLAEHFEAGVRVIDSANLSGLAIVDRPAYPASIVEARATKDGDTLISHIPGETNLSCKCSGPECRFARFSKPALQRMHSDMNEGDTLAALGSYGQPLAASSRGTLRGSLIEKGLQIEIDIPKAARQLVRDAMDAAPLLIRPYLDRDQSEGENRGGVFHYSRAKLRSFIVGASDLVTGWPVARFLRRRENRNLERQV